MNNKKIKLIEPVIDQKEIRGIIEVLRSGWLTEGPKTKKFEELIMKYLDVEFAIATTSCTTALELALRVIGVGPQDEVIIPDFTHPATGNIVRWVGAHPVLVDVDLFTYNIDFEQIEKALSNKVRCIIPVSWGGNPLNPKQLKEIKEKHNLVIIEDAACGLGAEYDGIKTGKMSDITCFSFHPRKIITTGEGGMLVTDNPSYANKVKLLKNFGMVTENKQNKFIEYGTNYKFSDILAIIGIKQMEKIEEIIKKRIELAKHYDELLSKVNYIRVPHKEKNARHTYQTYAIYIEKEGLRDKLIAHLRKKNIEVQIGTYALHLQPSYSEVKKIGKLENSAKLYRNLIALPMCHSMTKEEQERVVSEIKEFIRQNQ